VNITNSIHGLLHRHGTEFIKREVWNKQYSSLTYDQMNWSGKDSVIPYVEKYANGGNILDVGSGTGALGNSLGSNTYRHYLGIDVSSVAIDWANKHNEKGSKNTYVLADMCSFETNQKFSVILFADSLYYNPTPRVKLLLNAYANYLEPHGVLLMRTCDGRRTTEIVRLVESDYEIVEKLGMEFKKNVPVFIIAFRPKTSLAAVGVEMGSGVATVFSTPQ